MLKKIFTLSFIIIFTNLVCLWSNGIQKGTQVSDSIAISNDTATVSGDTIIMESINLIPSSQLNKETADNAYIEENFPTAINIYETLIKNNGESHDIYYNLGSSYYRIGDIAKSILNYEKALLLNPGDKDTRFNLALAQSKTVDKVETAYEIFFIVWINNIINLMSMNLWCIIGITTFLLFLFGTSIYLFSKKTLFKKIGFFCAIIGLIITIFSNLSALHQYHNLKNRNAAIIISPSIVAKSTPSNSGTDLFILHEGHKVNIIDNSMNNWKEIELEDGTRGWIPVESLEKI